MDDELETQFGHALVAEGDHLVEFPCGVDMQWRERRLRREEGPQGKMQERRGILANRVEQGRLAEIRRRFSQDMNALCFERLQMARWYWHAGLSFLNSATPPQPPVARRKVLKIFVGCPNEPIGLDTQGLQPTNRLVAHRVVQLLVATALPHMTAAAGTSAVQ